MKKFDADKKYFYLGVTAFVVIACCILLYLLIMHWSVFATGVEKVFRILSPFIWGFIIAYLLRPIMKFFERHMTERVGKKLFKKNEHRAFVFGRVCALIIAETLMILVVALLLWMVLPQLYYSIESIVLNSATYYNKLVEMASKLLTDYPQLEKTFVNLLGNVSESVIDWTKTSLLPQMTDVLTNITSGVYYFIRGIYYVVIGIIVSVYILYNKEAVTSGAKKLVYCIFSVPWAKKILEDVRFIDKTFMNFISGQMLDSVIIGFICYICCTIIGIPYTILIAVIVGLTNIIPFFGPFIGAIPSAIIILMVSPIKCLEFIIFIFLLQQFDGNILSPKILGESIGVDGFWVMFSIILGGGLFGFPGLLLGVPVFVVLYTGLKNLMDRKLKRSGLPTEPAVYENLRHFDPLTSEPIMNLPQPDEKQPGEGKKSGKKKKKTETENKDKPEEKK